jgi:isopenicillin-N epimerase
VVVSKVPFPLRGPSEICDAVLAATTDRTKIALIDHVTSATALVFPVERIVSELASRGVDTIVDGAHAPGMLELDVSRVGAAYYTGNCHKWLCAPKGAAFVHVRRDRQDRIRPLAISHGANSPRTDRSRFRLEFDWPGTDDPTAWLCVPTAIRFLGSLHAGGWPVLRASMNSNAVEARRMLCEALAVPAPSPASMLGSMTAIPLPGDAGRVEPLTLDPLQQRLFDEHRIEVPVLRWPAGRAIRASLPAYATLDEVGALARALTAYREAATRAF